MKVLSIDLTSGVIQELPISQDSVRHYLGGRGLGVRYLYDNLPENTDPLGPENILGLWTSPLMGTGAISMVKICGVTKSPQTGTILMSLMGGYFGPELRFTGVDGLIFHGKSEKPVYLVVKEDGAELRSAEELWGLTTRETAEKITQDLALKRVQVASIGPAGENLVAFASIMHRGDALGRGGIGAVMGSKNLKAIAVSGKARPELADPDRYQEAVKRIAQGYRESEAIALFGATGTTQHVDGLNLKHMYPTHNFQDGQFAEYQQVNADALYEKHVQKRISCQGCSVRCRREATNSEGPYAGTETEGPEYETLWGFGGLCGNDNLNAIIKANELCLEYGLDSISAAGVIAFGMECYENGLISRDDTGGIDLRFGNPEAIVEMLPLIARKEGLGAILAEGSRRAGERIGSGAGEYAMQVKGMELAGYDPRNAKGMALGYATSPRGGCHERGYLTAETTGFPPGVDRLAYAGKGDLVKEAQDTVAVKDSLSFCVLSSAGTSLDDLAELFSAAVGIELAPADLLEAGERINNLERLFNLREGFTRADDTLPRRFLKEPILDNKGNLQTVDLERLLDMYYAARGWDGEGHPLDGTLERLGLGSGAHPGSPVLSS
ncbi:MAG: aldehyde ferredoxin oxidoreductase family protein [Anaerolineales bacterium]